VNRTLVAASLALAPLIAAAAPLTVTHQGRVLDASGTPAAGAVDLRVRIYDVPSSGTALFDETLPAVPLSGGYYTVVLGAASTPLDVTDVTGGPRYVGVTVGAGAELAPRTLLTAVPSAVSATSVVAIDAPSTCTTANRGALQFTSAGATLEVCTGTAWQAVSGGAGSLGSPSNPGTDCAHLYANGVTTNGAYWINPGGVGQIQVYCDMAGSGSDGGGWTLVAKTNGGDQNHWGDTDFNVTDLHTNSTSTSAHMGNSRRIAVGRFYKVVCNNYARYGYLNNNTVLASANWNGNATFEWMSGYTTFSSDPNAYTLAATADCGTTDCPGPGAAGANWYRLNSGYPGCGIGSTAGTYSRTGTLWVK
jgi:hypothetical protein